MNNEELQAEIEEQAQRIDGLQDVVAELRSRLDDLENDHSALERNVESIEPWGF